MLTEVILAFLQAPGVYEGMSPSRPFETSWPEQDELTAHFPLSSLLLATVLSGSLWWGIIAGLHWIWQAI